MDVSQYLEIFIDETKEHLQSLNTSILELEQDPESMDTVNEIFRAAHSLKGMAGTMGYKRMQALTHDMENVFSEVRNGTIKVTAEIIDVLFQILDALDEYLNNIQSSADEGTNDNENLIKALNDFLNGKKGGSAKTVKESSKASETTSKAETAKESDADDKHKWKALKFNESQTHVMREAATKGMNVIGLTVYVQESCILKAARAFLVYKTLEDMGEVIISEPSAQDIEDEKFEFSFELFVISKESIDKVKTAIENVSEIRGVDGSQITEVPSADAKEEKAVETTKDTNETTTTPATTTTEPAKVNKAATTTQKPSGKPVVNRSVRVDIEKLDVLMNLVSELIIAKNGLVSVSAADGGTNSQGFNEQIEYLERVTTNLHESVMKVRMQPIETVTQKFPKMVRDLSKKLDKQMKLTISGEDTELDRTVIDEIGDPLMHLLRNSADHGLESAEVRAQRGKDPVGSILLKAYQDGNNVVIEVTDDGNGIDVEKVRDKALEKGTITPEQAETMSDKDIVDLLFKPSFSTAKQVTDVSGRGVGLDVVKTKIESLGGDIEVKTKLGEGSTFVIRLPLTLAIIQALMVEVGEEKYAISLGSIMTIEDVEKSDIKYVQQKEVINLRDNVIPIIRLHEVLDVTPCEEEPESYTVVIIKKGDRQAGLVVDRLIGQQEIVIKSLGKYIANNSKLISGATILGDGEVALIIDANTLV